MALLGERAVVLGASLAGMLAARVLSEHYRTVTVVERDVLEAQPGNRRGVPQARHGHALQSGGSAILDEFFPGILGALVADGAPVWDDGDLSKAVIEYGGHRFVGSGRTPNAVSTYQPSRALLDWHVLQRLSALPNVSLRSGYDVVGLTSTGDHRCVTGAVLARHDGTQTTAVEADLVVDATGRGSRTPVFFEQLGYGRPTEDELVVNLSYTSQWIRMPSEALREHIIALFPRPGSTNTVALLRHENDRWLLTIGAMAGDKPAADYPEMLGIARSRVPAHVREVLASAEPVGTTAHYRTPSSRWRRYDEMVRLPGRLLVTGDAVCSFNPIYGQGMTVAALDAMALRGCLRRGDQDLPRRYFQASAKNIRVAWRNAVNADLALPEIDGQRPIGVRLNNAFADWVLTAIETDPVVTGQFFRVLGMVDSPTRLMRPSILARVLRARFPGRSAASQSEMSLAS